jgi:copper chaperone CopZ
MHCVNCVNNIKSKIIKYQDKVNFFDIDLNSSKLFISLKDDKILDYIKNEIEALGYKFEVLNNKENNIEEKSEDNKFFF